MTTCEHCGKLLRQGDTIHGIKYGTLTNTGFMAAKDSAVSVICDDCGNKIYRFVYASLDEGKIAYPAIFKMYEELASVIKNGYKMIHSIATLPASDQRALQHLLISCNRSR